MRIFGKHRLHRPLIGLLLLSASSAAFTEARLDRQLLVNPDAETVGSGPVPGWQTAASFTTEAYIPAGNVPDFQGARIGGGSRYFFGGVNSTVSNASQTMDVTNLAGDIDTGGVSAVMGAFMAGYGKEDDYGIVTVFFQGAGGLDLGGTLRLGPQVGDGKGWVYRNATGKVPVGTRKITVIMSGMRFIGNNVDAFFDNLSLVLTRSLPYPPLNVPVPAREFRTDELILNGSAEAGDASASGNEALPIPNWTTTGNFTAAKYGGPYVPIVLAAVLSSAGANTFSGGSGTDPASASQTVDISASADLIDAGKLSMRFSLLMGTVGTGGNDANANVEALDAGGVPLMTLYAGDVVGNNSSLATRIREANLPPGTRQLRVQLNANATENGTYNAAFFDNVSLRLIDSIPVPDPIPSYNPPIPVSYGSNLLLNPGAEDNVASFDDTSLAVPLPNWTTTGNFSAVLAYDPVFLIAGAVESIGGGRAFFAGGPNTPFSTATQTVDISRYSQAVDEKRVKVHLGAAMGGYTAQADYGQVIATFLDYATTPLGSIVLPAVFGNDPFGSDLNNYSTDGEAPPGTRQIQVMLVATRLNGVYNDAYFDNIVLSLNRRNGPDGLLGDVSDNGSVGTEDIILLLRSTLGLVGLSEEQVRRADMNDDGFATLSDAPLLLRQIVGLPWEG